MQAAEAPHVAAAAAAPSAATAAAAVAAAPNDVAGWLVAGFDAGVSARLGWSAEEGLRPHSDGISCSGGEAHACCRHCTWKAATADWRVALEGAVNRGWGCAARGQVVVGWLEVVCDGTSTWRLKHPCHLNLGRLGRCVLLWVTMTPHGGLR